MIYVGKIRPDTTRTELRDRFEVFGEIEDLAVFKNDINTASQKIGKPN